MIFSMFQSIFVFIVVAYCLTTVGGNTINGSYDDIARQLQTEEQTLNYRATYNAEFHHFRYTFCTGDPPVLRLTCFGANMKIISRSDPSIICIQMDEPLITNGTSYECQNTCIGSVCSRIYASNELNTPFGSITYTCEGNDYREVDSSFTFVGGSNGTCSATSLGSDLQNYHISRLGVSCPSEIGRKFVYDDTYFECISGIGPFDLAIGSGDDIYACSSGGRCNQLECDIMFEDFNVNSQVVHFLDECVELKENVDLTTSPTSSPKLSGFQYSVKFEASWAQLYDSAFTRSACATVANTPVQITCENGASLVSFNSSENCARISDNILQCNGSTNSSVNQFNSVFYDCVGPNIPTTRVTYMESSATCNGNSAVAIIDHAVTLGVYCDIKGDQFFYYGDLVVDCVDSDHDFDSITNLYGLNQTRYVCKESAIFAVGSSSSNSIIIPSVAIATDEFWLIGEEGCFQQKQIRNDPMPSPVSIPAPNPIVGSLPISPSPINSPILSPAVFPIISSIITPSILPTKSMAIIEPPSITVPSQPSSPTVPTISPTQKSMMMMMMNMRMGMSIDVGVGNDIGGMDVGVGMGMGMGMDGDIGMDVGIMGIGTGMSMGMDMHKL